MWWVWWAEGGGEGQYTASCLIDVLYTSRRQGVDETARLSECICAPTRLDGCGEGERDGVKSPRWRW